MAEIKGFEIHALETSFMVFDRKDSFGISYKSFLLSLTILFFRLIIPEFLVNSFIYG